MNMNLGRIKLMGTVKLNLADTLDKLATKRITLESTEEEIYRYWLLHGMRKTKAKQRKYSEGIMHLLYEKQQKVIEEQLQKIERLNDFLATVVNNMELINCDKSRDGKDAACATSARAAREGETKKAVVSDASRCLEARSVAALRVLAKSSKQRPKRKRARRKGSDCSKSCESCNRAGHEAQRCWRLGRGHPPPYFLKRCAPLESDNDQSSSCETPAFESGGAEGPPRPPKRRKSTTVHNDMFFRPLLHAYQR